MQELAHILYLMAAAFDANQMQLHHQFLMVQEGQEDTEEEEGQDDKKKEIEKEKEDK